MRGNRWTDEQRSTARELRSRGMSYAAIGLFMGRPLTSVRAVIEETKKPAGPPPGSIERCCLRCKRKFWAPGRWIRLCDWCKRLPIFSS